MLLERLMAESRVESGCEGRLAGSKTAMVVDPLLSVLNRIIPSMYEEASVTLRCRLPVLLSELISEGVDVEFCSGDPVHSPLVSWYCEKKKIGGHHHLDPEFQPGVHGANALLIENYLADILAEVRGHGVQGDAT
jgi:hypothetical protein